MNLKFQPPPPPPPPQPPQPPQPPKKMKITCASLSNIVGSLTLAERDELIDFLKQVPLKKFKLDIKAIDKEPLNEKLYGKHTATAFGSVRDNKFNFGFILLKRADHNGNANDDSMESIGIDIEQEIKRAIEQEGKKTGPDMGIS